jgi:hypothetical protein
MVTTAEKFLVKPTKARRVLLNGLPKKPVLEDLSILMGTLQLQAE